MERLTGEAPEAGDAPVTGEAPVTGDAPVAGELLTPGLAPGLTGDTAAG